MRREEIVFCPFCGNKRNLNTFVNRPMKYTLYYDGDLRSHRFECQNCGADIRLPKEMTKTDAFRTIKEIHSEQIRHSLTRQRVECLESVFQQWEEPYKTFAAAIIANGSFDEKVLKGMVGEAAYNKAMNNAPKGRAAKFGEN